MSDTLTPAPDVSAVLPEAFVRDVATWPLDDADRSRFLQSFGESPYRALRLRCGKIPPDRTRPFLDALHRRHTGTPWPDPPTPVPWQPGAYYLPEDLAAGADPSYLAGLYYLQEPSAMLPAAVLHARPGERILDLCAAPGGKTTQIAEDLAGQGLLIANDIDPVRARELRVNVERMGYDNVRILSATGENVAATFGPSFDAVLVDAPCSGEARFAKQRTAATSWEQFGPDHTIPMQDALLDAAAALLKPGGRLVYATCTFNPRENEARIDAFLKRHPSFEVVPDWPDAGVRETASIRGGLPLAGLSFDPSSCLRIWPQDGKGQGHFCALLRRRSSAASAGKGVHVTPEPHGDPAPTPAPSPVRHPSRRKGRRGTSGRPEAQDPAALWASLESFLATMLTPEALRRFREDYPYRETVGSHLYVLPERPPDPGALRVVKYGLHVAEVKGRRADVHPAHDLLRALPGTAWRFPLRRRADDDWVRRLVAGQTLTPEAVDRAVMDAARAAGLRRAYFPVLVEGWPFAWVKQQGNLWKNLFPTGQTRTLPATMTDISEGPPGDD